MKKKIMKAVILTEPTLAKDIVISDTTIPKVKSGWVLVRVKAFGMNHSESILRLHEIEKEYINKPVIPGIECVGEIADASDSNFKNGQKVIAMMGGMGRSFNGSYAEYALLPKHHVFAVESDLPYEQLAAIPETYYTAWGSLFESLQLKKEDTLLIRGATCALGYACIQLANALGCTVSATTHKVEKMELLKKYDVDEILFDDGRLGESELKFTKIVELVGAKTLRDSLHMVKKGGIICQTGILGGVFALNIFDAIKDIPNGVYLTGFHSNYPTQKDVNDIFNFINKHKLQPLVGSIYDFSNIKEACKSLDEGKVNGKIVIRVEV